MSKTGRPEAESGTIRTREHLVESFQSLVDEAKEVLVQAKDRGDSRLALLAIKSAIESLTSIGKALNLLQPDGQTIVDARVAGVAILERLSEDELRALAYGKPIAALSAGAAAVEVIDATEEPAEAAEAILAP